MEKNGIFYGLNAVAHAKENILMKRKTQESKNVVASAKTGTGMSFAVKAELCKKRKER